MCHHGPDEQRGYAALMRESLHDRLVARQSTDELERKARLAERRARIWTQEEIDLAVRRGAERCAELNWD